RLLMALEAEGKSIPIDKRLDCFYVAVGSEAEKQSMSLIHELRKTGIKVDKDIHGSTMKSQIKAAEHKQATYEIILREDELSRQVVTMKKMATGDQMEIPIDQLSDKMKELFKGGKGHD